MSGDDGEERGFTVVDRRASSEREEPGEGSEQAGSGDLPRIDFSTFCLSLATSALYHLGVARDPTTGATAPEPSLPLARQTIDALEMLRDKTQGNLDEEEGKLIESLLYELHVRFVEVSQGGGGE